jgi:hypothetical protein
VLTTPSVLPPVRNATVDDLTAIRRIYNEGTQNRVGASTVFTRSCSSRYRATPGSQGLYRKFGYREVGMLTA